MKYIFEDNPSYKYVDLKYHPSSHSNMVYASLIVEIND